MMKITMFLPLFVIATSINAQEGTNPNPTPTQPGPAVETQKKNEISINTAPLFRVLLAGESSQATRFSATYKRNLTGNSALRFSIMADMINGSGYYPNQWNDAIVLQTDSVLIKQTTVNPGYVSPHVNIGYERLFGKRKLRWFYGADLTLGYYESQSYKQNKTLERDTAFGPNAWVEVMHNQPDIVSKTQTKAYAVGISPFFGAKFPISKRLSISAQVGADMTFQDREMTVITAGKTEKFRVSTFDFNLNTGILNDISLIYKF